MAEVPLFSAGLDGLQRAGFRTELVLRSRGRLTLRWFRLGGARWVVTARERDLSEQLRTLGSCAGHWLAARECGSGEELLWARRERAR